MIPHRTDIATFIVDYFSKWTEAFPIKDKCVDTVADVLVDKIILRFGMPLVMMGEECSLPQDVSTDELRTNREHDVAPHPFATWVRDALEVTYGHVRHSLHQTAARRKRLYEVKAVNRKFPVGSWVLQYYPPAAQKKLGSPWICPQQVVRQATGHTVGIQKEPDAPIVFIHVDDLKICPPPSHSGWTPEPSTAKSLYASPVAFQPGSHISDSDSTPSVDVSNWNDLNTPLSSADIHLKLDQPIDLTGHILSPFFVREFVYQDCRFHSVAHLMCYRYAVIQGLKTFVNGIRKWAKHLTDFHTPASRNLTGRRSVVQCYRIYTVSCV